MGKQPKMNSCHNCCFLPAISGVFVAPTCNWFFGAHLVMGGSGRCFLKIWKVNLEGFEAYPRREYMDCSCFKLVIPRVPTT